jgi:hypothetical protein
VQGDTVIIYLNFSGLHDGRQEKRKFISVRGCGGPQGYEKSRISHFVNNRLTDGGEVCLKRQSSLPTGRFLVLISVRGCVDPRAIVRLEGLGQLKNPMTSSGK